VISERARVSRLEVLASEELLLDDDFDNDEVLAFTCGAVV
jgi:hypothetical protein